MRKNIKKIIDVAIITVSIFTLMGCGQTKENLKEEIKQEIKADETGVKTEEVKEVTKESLVEFEKGYKEYVDVMKLSSCFLLEDNNDHKITIEQAKEYNKKAELIGNDILLKSPSVIKEDLKTHFSLYNDYFTKVTTSLKLETEEMPYWNKVDDQKVIIDKKIKELHTQLDNK